MRRLYLARHGETEANRLKIIQGQNNQRLNYGDYLNTNGEKQAVLLGKALADVNFQFIYTSPARRAFDTAHRVLLYNRNARNRISSVETRLLEVKNGLLEIDQGTFEGMRTDEIVAQYPKLYNFYHTKPSQFIFPHGESILEAEERVGKVIDCILRHRLFTENVLVVSHGGTISLALIHIFGLDMDRMYHAIRHYNCAFSIIEWPSQGAKPRIECLNDISHLK